MKTPLLALLIAPFLITSLLVAEEGREMAMSEEGDLSLIVETPEEGFQLAIKLARKGVTETQQDRRVLFELREVYARDANALIASSQVVAIHFQTVAAANNYWRHPAPAKDSQ